jgi:hypothetical protein
MRARNLVMLVGLAMLLPFGRECQARTSSRSLQLNREPPVSSVEVPERVAALVRPILDLRADSMAECGQPGVPSKCTNGELYNQEQIRQKKLGELLYRLVRQKGPSADEALVVLMCFYIGESQEETDSVIARGRKMLIYLNQYFHTNPTIPNRSYPTSMMKTPSAKDDDFGGAITSITHGRHNTADNPRG